MRPPTIMEEKKANTTLSQNPRRKPAAYSVSLIHRRSSSPPPNDDDTDSSSMHVDAASDVPAIPTKPTTKQHSSGESSNAEKWFEKSNNNLNPDTKLTDDDPPFLLRNNSSTETSPPEAQRRAQELLMERQRQHQDLLEQLKLSQLNNDAESASDDYRSVIDDLTIENKRLKQRLRKFERSQGSKLNNEALFEIRYHSAMPPEKRKQLENLLQDFASKVTPSSQPATSIANLSTSIIPSSLQAGPSSSSNSAFMTHSNTNTGSHSHSHSRSKQGDSGYASMSMSGSKSSGNQDTSGPMSFEQRNNIQNYLSDIPAGLLPNRMGPMSDREKKKIIVQKLEQLFVGRDSSGTHNQPKQQERVAQAAARYDRKSTEASGDDWTEEGAREAKIMPEQLNTGKPNDASNTSDSRSKSDNTSHDITMFDDLIEQRPTRPLDLDPHRAQVPAENIQYMRHLGFSPPDEERMVVQPDGHGWIYLNVLSNMAQLHFTNVTTSFTQKAIAEYSNKLELSSDGRKVRWAGIGNTPNMQYDSSPDHDGSSRPKDISSSLGKNALRAFDSQFKRRVKDKLAYSPLFRNREESENGTTMEEDHMYQTSNAWGASSALASSSTRNLARQQSTDDNAPIIFYQHLPFYTDLSGDPTNTYGGMSNPHRRKSIPIGEVNTSIRLDHLREMEYEKGPLSSYQPLTDPSPDHLSTSTDSGLKGLPSRLQKSASSESSSNHVIELEASGIGGVHPADNFAINVRSRQQKREGTPMSFNKRSKAYQMPIRKALLQKNKAGSSALALESKRDKPSPKKEYVGREIITLRKKDLEPSSLPEPTYFHQSSDDDSDDDQDEEDVMDYEFDDESESDEVPRPATQHMDWPTVAASSNPSTNGDEDEEDQDQDEDLLTHADTGKRFKDQKFKNSAIASSKFIKPKLNQNVKSMNVSTAPSVHDYAIPSSVSKQPRPYPSPDSKLKSQQPPPPQMKQQPLAPPSKPIAKKKMKRAGSTASSESIDLLAPARELDPENIRLQEREFDASVADRLAEEIPAGSSAATAEGGSGFTSPVYTAPPTTNSNQLFRSNMESRRKGKKRGRAVEDEDGAAGTPRARKSPKVENSKGVASPDSTNEK